ncbi:Ku protein [Shinella sp.]|uniref:non-homologous end joining protein Ku n=1 Tax=Shinella sp. TaxID=1870904 RepID=UPI003F6FAE60
MSPRAQWKGYLKIDEIGCAVALYTAASTSERTSFHTINKKTGNRVKRVFVDEKTEKPVDRDDQVKGYETDQGEYIILEPEEVNSVIPESDKTLRIEHFIPCSEVDTVYFDKPYYIAPADDAAEDAFRLIRDGLQKKKVAALATAVLFRRVRHLMLRPHGEGIVANTLNFDYEVRSAEDAFADAPQPKVKKQMVELAGHIIETMRGEFDPTTVGDRYEAALAELVKAKIEGRPIKPVKRPKEGKIVDLMEALRESAKLAQKPKAKARPATRKKAA